MVLLEEACCYCCRLVGFIHTLLLIVCALVICLKLFADQVGWVYWWWFVYLGGLFAFECVCVSILPGAEGSGWVCLGLFCAVFVGWFDCCLLLLYYDCRGLGL